MEADYKNELLQFLKEKLDEVHVVVMPDFFHDRLINLDYDIARFSAILADKIYRKGGSIDGIAQIDLRGGNAINTASALASLGVNVTPIVCTNKIGLQQIKFYLRKYRVDLSHIKIMKKPSLTTALEFKMENGRANVMLRDLGALANFNSSDLTDSDYELIENADYVCLFNWAGTKKHGTILAENVFRRVKSKGKGKTYYDPADPTPNRDEIPELVNNVLTTNQVDVLSLNENEAICYSGILNGEICEKRKKQRFEELALEAARILVKYFSARIDLHTTLFSATLTKKNEVIVPAFKIKALRATGAGDAWNAGNILGDTNTLTEECRLALANAVSAYYLSNLDGAHPTRRKLIKFVKKLSLNSVSGII